MSNLLTHDTNETKSSERPLPTTEPHAMVCECHQGRAETGTCRGSHTWIHILDQLAQRWLLCCALYPGLWRGLRPHPHQAQLCLQISRHGPCQLIPQQMLGNWCKRDAKKLHSEKAWATSCGHVSGGHRDVLSQKFLHSWVSYLGLASSCTVNLMHEHIPVHTAPGPSTTASECYTGRMYQKRSIPRYVRSCLCGVCGHAGALAGA